MFFPQKIISIQPSDKVLEIGPGATPYFRSDVFLEKKYQTTDELIAQSGRVGVLQTNKKVIYYEGGVFPFDENEFDYIICSNVLEHVDNIDLFLNEVQRVGRKGYIEFPTVYYDYIYNIPEHQNLLFYNEGNILWMPKSDSGIDNFISIQEFFFKTLELGYFDYIESCKDYFFQGFEWHGKIRSIRTQSLNELTYSKSQIQLKLNTSSTNCTAIDYNSISIRKLVKHKLKHLLNIGW